MSKRIMIITDVWKDTTVNGVVTYIINIKRELEVDGNIVEIVTPSQFPSMPLPTYPEIRIALPTRRRMEEIIRDFNPDYIHIATQVSLGLAARMVCTKLGLPFTTFYHTRIPEYIDIRVKGFKTLTYEYLIWFHKACANTMVSTPSLQRELAARHFHNVVVSPLGIDTQLFMRNEHAPQLPYLKPVFTYLGRVAPEKNIEAFLECKLPGSKLIIGDGPSKEELARKYAEAHFAGYKHGQELVDMLSASDVFVFPSKTDTFGLVVVEAMACGLPVAAYNVVGPGDIVTSGVDGYLGDDLADSAVKCLKLDRNACIQKARSYSWRNAALAFLKNCSAAPVKIPSGHAGPNWFKI